ncbi:dopamine receptor D4 related sequence [Hemiscyllium ocellatum]|uniref:dopamine receptor D4 related sequence n=1 Tax=Hemiscyllium ocellatum TaxID=170820 RepID=UPI0029667B92|nr:dopamine receptor D4 related sequence [Hemiscyllium ocellatum]
MSNGTVNRTHGVDSSQYNYLALVFGVPLIVAIILGNVLVCLSVLIERSLKTATNYFIVSLAVADLLLAVLVLPLFVYTEFQGGIWTLNSFLCDALMTMDVMLCTASIFNLCAISVDRYVAVIVPLKYNRNHFSGRQLILIMATWLLSLGVASPVIFGLNNVPGRDVTDCKLEDGTFVVYSSVCSFFVPCPIMLLLYYGMFRGLKRWGESRRITLPSRDRTFAFNLSPRKRERHMVKYIVPNLSPNAAKNIPESHLITTQLDSTSDVETPDGTKAGTPKENGALSRHGLGREPFMRSRRVSGRERKAMKVLPIVVGVFLACWTPFFVVHVLKVLCEACSIGSMLISVVTWLGYVNSAVNPIIYTIFNTEFRNIFQKLLHCQT